MYTDKKRILCIEDEVKITRFLELELKHEGYDVDVAYDGRLGLDKFEKGKYDLILLDLMLPGIDGLEVLRGIRRVSDVPVIMLTAKSEIIDKVVSLDSGADDYMTKPFAIEEALARMRVALKKRAAFDSSDGTIGAKGLSIDLNGRAVTVNGEPVELTKTEYELLVLLVKNKNSALSRDEILTKVWGYDYFGETNAVDVYIRYLRSKIDDKFDIKLIHTIRGIGYIVKD
ncbi:MAG: response regulator transcription factor [Clostridiales bacterium]|jgi:DNA-binding response OmpR family regulator|nr:response regulator transcription factor [Clostridiales bacterium]